MERKKLVMLSVFASLFVGVLIAQTIMYNSGRTVEKVSIYGTYDSVDYSVPMNFGINIQIVKSNDYDEGVQHPAVILLHGDGSNSRFFNNIQIELLKFGYCLALINVGYWGLDVFLYLNETLNYLLEQTDIDPAKIGVLGHSHGGHYVTLFSTMRNDSINAAVCANWGDYNYWYDDYYPYYRNFVAKNESLSTNYSEFTYYNGTMSLPMNLSSQRNFLMVSDRNDDRPELPLEDYFMNFTENMYPQANILHGDFSDGSARELFASSSIFGHGSSLFLPDAIYEQVKWFNTAFDVDPSSVYESADIQILFLNFLTYFGFLSVTILLVSGIGFIGQILPDIVNQKTSIRTLMNRLLKNRVERTSNEEDSKEEKAGKNEKESKEDPIDTENYGKQTIQNDISKKFLLSIILLGLIISGYLFMRNSFSFNYVICYNLENLPEYILGLSGFDTWQLYIFITDFPFSLMFFWVVGLLVIDARILKGTIMKSLSESKLKSVAYEVILGIEVYILLFLVFRYSFLAFLGEIIEPIYLLNVIFGLFVFYYILKGYSMIYKTLPKKSGRYFYAIVINILLYCLFYLPRIINFEFGEFSFHIIAIVFLSLMNPHIIEKKVPILVIAMVNYFGFLFFYQLL